MKPKIKLKTPLFDSEIVLSCKKCVFSTEFPCNAVPYTFAIAHTLAVANTGRRMDTTTLQDLSLKHHA